MKKKNKILTILVVIVLLALVVMANVWRSRSLAHGVRVNIDYRGADTLVEAGQISNLILHQMPSLTSTRLSEVDLQAVEQAAARSPYLRRCQAGTSIGGSVVLFAEQRRPIMRLFVKSGVYYVDDEGFRFPVGSHGSADVIVASGNIPDRGDGLKAVWQLAMFLNTHPDVSPLFDQIYRDARGDLFLVPKLGDHIVQVGSADNLEEKFANLMAFYTRGLPQVGWETYKQVSVKYKGQVVCTKRQAVKS